MPRPKRIKIAPMKPIPRARKVANNILIDSTSVASKASFDDLYDVSDQEYDQQKSSRWIEKSKGKQESCILNQQTRELVEIKRNPSKNGEKIHNRRSAKRDSLESGFSSSLSDPEIGIEIARKEQRTPVKGSLIHAMSNLRTRSNSTDLDIIVIPSRGGSRQNESSDLDIDSEVKIGNLRQSTRHKNVAPTPKKTANSIQYANTFGNEYSFDASTPLNIANANANAKTLNLSSSASSSKSKKRKLSEIQVLQSSYEIFPPTLPDNDDTIPATDQQTKEDSIMEDNEENLMPSVVGASFVRQKSYDIMAPPHSSSSISSSPIDPCKLARGNSRNLRSSRKKTPRAEKDLNLNSSSPPSLTYSPDLPVKSESRAKTKRKPLSPCSFSTAQLQALLPKRRRRIAHDVQDNTDSENEIDISGLASDEDELTNLIVNPRARNRDQRLSNVAPTRASVSHKKSASKTREEIKNSRNYVARSRIHSDASDNVEMDNHSVPSIEHDNLREATLRSEKSNCKELKKAAQKFQEVDKWELEFEDATESSASPKDAR